MKVLLYIDPWVDISDKPEFKLPWFRWFLKTSITNLQNYCLKRNNNLELKVLYSDILNSSSLKKEFKSLEFIAIEQSAIKNIFSDFNEYLSLQKFDKNHQKFQSLNKVILKKLNGFTPDIIILISTSAKYLKFAFPNSLILFTESGLFNQPPYPGCLYFDCCSTMNESFLLKFKNDLLELKANKNELEFLSKIRDFFSESISKNNPYKDLITDLRGNFKYLILLSLQRFESPIFRTQSDFKDQIEYIKYVFDNVDSRVGIIVTEHTKDKMLNFELIHDYFKNNHKNFIFLDESKNVKNSSQFLLELVDGVITVSSTVGLQALLYKKPLFVPSKISYLSAFCEETDLSKVINFLEKKKLKNKDGALFYMISRYYILNKYYCDGEWFYNFLSNSLNNFKKGIDINFYQKIDKNVNLMTEICQKSYLDNFELSLTNPTKKIPFSMKKRVAKLINSIKKRLIKWQIKNGL